MKMFVVFGLEIMIWSRPILQNKGNQFMKWKLLSVVLQVAFGIVPMMAQTSNGSHFVQTLSTQETLVEITVPVIPIPTPANGKIVLAYELHLTNFDVREINLTRLEIKNDASSADMPLAVYEGDVLAAMMQPRALYGKPADNRRIGVGVRTVVYLWLTLDAGKSLPSILKHRLTFTPKSTVENTAPVEIFSEVTVRISKDKPIVISHPLRGSIWLAGNGPSNADTGHRRGMTIVDGHTRLPSRFAIDWVQYGKNDKPFSNDEFKNSDYYAYGAEILAVASGVVSAVKDGIPENVPGPNSRAVPITNDTIAGNYVMLNLGGGRYALYAHLQPNSLRVIVGQRVQRGQVLGLLGNSGNSDAPHLHFQICSANSPLDSEGLPFVLRSFELIGRDGRALPGGKVEKHMNEMPVMYDVLNFGSADKHSTEPSL